MLHNTILIQICIESTWLDCSKRKSSIISNGRSYTRIIKYYNDGDILVQSMRTRYILHAEESTKFPILMTCMYSIQLASVSVKWKYLKNMELSQEEGILQSWLGILSLSLAGITEATWRICISSPYLQPRLKQYKNTQSSKSLCRKLVASWKTLKWIISKSG